VRIQVVTVSVSSLDRSRSFYEGVLGFEPDVYYEPTRWQSYRFEGDGGFGIAEAPGLDRSATSDIINFVVDDVETLWRRVKDRADVEAELATTPWGAYKFVLRDPDGFRLGFVGASADDS
jgi:catechol 2,3-dioxygenase-like lactoylglutathione lyase family enzyme